MDCHLNGNTELCLRRGVQKCNLVHENKLRKQSGKYFDCMESQYEQFHGTDDPLKFCKLAYGNSSEFYTKKERFGWSIDKVEKNSFSQSMYQCYSKNENVKEFCDDVHMLGYQNWTTNQELLSCYNQFRLIDGSNIKNEDIANLEKQIECDSKTSAAEKFQCLDTPTSKIEFCHDKYVIDMKLSSTKESA